MTPKLLTLSEFIAKHGPSEAARRLKVGRMALWRWMHVKDADKHILPVTRAWAKTQGVKL